MLERIKNSKTTMKILSLILAVVLWLVLIYTVNPQISQKINNVEITFKGIDALKEKGLVPVNLEKSSFIDVEVNGRRTDVISALENITASADLSGVTVKGTRIENVNVNTGVAGVYVTGRGTPTVTVEIDEIGEKRIPLEIVHTGSEKNKQTIAVSDAVVDEITVTGALSELEVIDRAVVTIAAQDIDKRSTRDMQYVLYTADGDKHTPDTVKAEPTTVSVTSGLYPRKSLPVKVRMAEEYEDDYIIDAKIKTKDSVDVGVVSLDSDIEEIIAVFEPDMYESGKTEYEIELTVPDGVYLQDASKMITAEIAVKKKSVKRLMLDVEVRNVAGGLVCERDDYKADITLSGAAVDLQGEGITAYVDADKLGEGEHELEVKLEAPDTVFAVKDERIRIKLVKQEG